MSCPGLWMLRLDSAPKGVVLLVIKLTFKNRETMCKPEAPAALEKRKDAAQPALLRVGSCPELGGGPSRGAQVPAARFAPLTQVWGTRRGTRGAREASHLLGQSRRQGADAAQPARRGVRCPQLHLPRRPRCCVSAPVPAASVPSSLRITQVLLFLTHLIIKQFLS